LRFGIYYTKTTDMDFIMNKSCDDESALSITGLLTIKLLPDELKSVQTEIKELKERCKFCNDFCPPLWCAKKLLEENEELKEHLNSLLTEEQKDIIKGEGLINPENAIYCPDDLVKRIQSFLKERDELAEENVQLNDDDWVITYHKALKYKCVLDEDYYLQHLNDEGQLIDPDEFNALQEENKKLKEENEKIGELVISQTDKLKEVSIKYNEGYKIESDDKCEKCGKGEKDFEDMFDGDALSTYAVNGKLWCPDCIHDDCNDESDEDEDEDEDEENKKLKEEIEKLRSSEKRRQQWFQCLMDCRDNPDNPDKQEIDEWCDAYNKSKKVRKELYEDFMD
tara:strand:- start:667 stop:1680 length:1014 start_codon:yes stop_codon:yes gene_type:complete